MLSNKKIMIIGGGEWQTPIIKTAKQMGLFVINTNLYKDSPGFKFSDECAIVDVLDKEKNLSVALQYSPHAVVTDQSDIAVPTVAYVCEKLNLPGIGVEKAELFTNKYLMRNFCQNHNFSIPDFRLCNSFNEVINASIELKFPIVLKPIQNQSSRGVYKIDNYTNLKRLYNKALVHCKQQPILVEEFIPGVELTVEGLKLPDKHISLAVSQKSHLIHNPVVAQRLLYTCSNEKIDYNHLKSINNDLVESMGLSFGITHAEYKFYNNRFYLIEIAARGGGTKISSDIVPLMCEINVLEVLIKLALGNDVGSITPQFSNNCVALEFFDLKPGKIKQIKNFEKIQSHPNIIDAKVFVKAGDKVLKPSDDRGRHGYFIAYEENLDKLNQLCENIQQMLEIKYETSLKN